MQKNILFIDLEVSLKKLNIQDIGAYKPDGDSFHASSISDFYTFAGSPQFICGHNIIQHDLKYLAQTYGYESLKNSKPVDTLFLSPLLFPAKPYHALVKDDKLQSDELNNPLNDALKACELFHDEISAFNAIDDTLQKIFYALLNKVEGFAAFFEYIGYQWIALDVEILIRERFEGCFCTSAPLEKMMHTYPVELAYCLSLINVEDRYSITPPWVLFSYPFVNNVMNQLRNKPCNIGCDYCNEHLNIYKGLKRFFGFDTFKTYAGESLQRDAVKAALNNESLLTIFPTGGGKSLTFQLPALMNAETTKGLTVVISPLQSLMKDQVDNLEKLGITDAVTINGLLDPIERGKSFERVEDGAAALLYISPESLRSISVERLLMGRTISRFVIDEAHCFSSWGQDFRVDYLYIGDFIKNLQEQKKLTEPIPVSCFTATAKPKVIEDIKNYLKEKLNLDLKLFTARNSRTNLQYSVLGKKDEQEKYNALRDMLMDKNCPSIVYVSRTRKASLLAEQLNKDGLNALPYHGKMAKELRTEHQNKFISGEVRIMVATSAFGMGVDKKDVGLVVHYDISDSLENYVQEAGRAGRDEDTTAECCVLYNENDLSKHFLLLNQTKLHLKEIQQVWKALRDLTLKYKNITESALVIARKAGWDDTIEDVGTRISTAVAAIEDAGFIKRGHNVPRIFANSILSKTATDAINIINKSEIFSQEDKATATRIIRKLFSSKSKISNTGEAAESRVDYISDILGLEIKNVINIVNLLREVKILADTKDLTAFIKKGQHENNSMNILIGYVKLEHFLLPYIEQKEKNLHIKELVEKAELKGIKDVSPRKIKTVLNYWAVKNWIKKQHSEYSRNHIDIIGNETQEQLGEKIEKRLLLSKFILNLLYKKALAVSSKQEIQLQEVLVEFSVYELKDEFEKKYKELFEIKINASDVEDALFYLSRIEAIKIEGGFLVIYNKLTIERKEIDRYKYSKEDYKKLKAFYDNKIQQIHIVGEYANKMLDDYSEALQFVDDYFRLNYQAFLQKYFTAERLKEIHQNITPAQYNELFGTLSPTQLKIIQDNTSKNIIVAAGPGSGKTKVLVHKLASLLLLEDIKHEQMLMLTFSRAAATEFKKRLIKLIGNAAYFVEIKTFHSYCFDLLGRVGTLEKTDDIIRNTIQKIKNKEIDLLRITKSVLVIDEAQDMDKDEYELIQTLIEHNEDMRLIAVGDDDQNIYAFRGSDAKYLYKLHAQGESVLYELTYNFRSPQNLVEFSNQFIQKIKNRLKKSAVEGTRKENGRIELTRYVKKNLIIPLVDDVVNARLSASTCILTRTNDEALLITGLLREKGETVLLVQSNDYFNLYMLYEIRCFIKSLYMNEGFYIIDNDKWKKAKEKLKKQFNRSTKLDLCMRIIKEFEQINPYKMYISDFESYLRESKLEDFCLQNKEMIYVSTMHKAKGKEYDNVFLLLDDFGKLDNEKIRQIYVALTRAKKNLFIHTNNNYFDSIETEGMIKNYNKNSFPIANELYLHLTHEDVNLGFFRYAQKASSILISGAPLYPTEDGCTNEMGELVLKYSESFKNKLNEYITDGYQFIQINVGFIIYWLDDDAGHEFKVVLPELHLERKKVTVI